MGSRILPPPASGATTSGGHARRLADGVDAIEPRGGGIHRTTRGALVPSRRTLNLRGGGGPASRYKVGTGRDAEGHLCLVVAPGSRRAVGGDWTDDGATEVALPAAAGSYNVYLRFQYGDDESDGSWVETGGSPFHVATALEEENQTHRNVRLATFDLVATGVEAKPWRVTSMTQRHFEDVEIYDMGVC